MSSPQELLLAVFVIFCSWLFGIYLPRELGRCALFQEYGRVAARRRQIEILFLRGELTSVSFYFDKSRDFFCDEFQLTISGPFGTHTKTGMEETLRTEVSESAPLPPAVARAFDGYSNTVSGVVHLLAYQRFLSRFHEHQEKKFQVVGDMRESLAIMLAHS